MNLRALLKRLYGTDRATFFTIGSHVEVKGDGFATTFVYVEQSGPSEEARHLASRKADVIADLLNRELADS